MTDKQSPGLSRATSATAFSPNPDEDIKTFSDVITAPSKQDTKYESVLIRSYASFTFATGPATFLLPPNTDVHRIMNSVRFSRKAQGEVDWAEASPTVMEATADGCPRVSVSGVDGTTWEVKIAAL